MPIFIGNTLTPGLYASARPGQIVATAFAGLHVHIAGGGGQRGMAQGVLHHMHRGATNCQSTQTSAWRYSAAAGSYAPASRAVSVSALVLYVHTYILMADRVLHG